MGGNVGLSTPYYAINSEPPPEPLIPTLYPMDDASPMYVNGQRVTATLDGMPISYGQAMSMLQNGSAIPAALASYMSDPRFRYENVGLGMFRAYTVVGHRDTSPTPTLDFSPSQTVENNVWGWASFSMPVSWSAQQQTYQGQSQQINNPSDCEKKLAGIFTDDPKGTLFVDVTDGDGRDPVLRNVDSAPLNKFSDEHNHLYNTGDDIKKATNIFAPAGGVVVGSGVLDAQNWLTVHYKSLSGIKNVILQLWHVENYNDKGGIAQKDRSILLGQMGKNGSFPYFNLGTDKKGWHIHIQAFSWWGKINRKGALVGNKLGARSVKVDYRLKLSDLFCK